MLRHWTVGFFGLWMVCSGAQAASCGTFAAPTACSLTVGGQTTFAATNFDLANSSGTTVYQAGDIGIDLSAGPGSSIVLSFRKLAAGPTPGVVFAANSGQSSNFLLRYNLGISAAQPGTVAFASLAQDVVLATSSATSNGVSSIQMVLSQGVTSSSCQAIRNLNGVANGDCTLPAGVGASMLVGDFVGLSGLSGNTSIGTFENRFDAVFTAAVPEPGTWALMGVGVLVLGWRVRRRR